MLPNPLHAENPLIVKHYQQQDRYSFGLKVLTLALSKLDTPFHVQTPQGQFVNEKRGENQIIDGQLDLQWMSTTMGRENDMIPIKIPLYRGLLGLRLLLVKKERHDQLSGINDLKGLQNHIGGHGVHWGDLPVYKANNLRVVTNVNYEKLFQLLIGNRFDYFHRGVNEIWEEQNRYSDKLKIADNVMLYYPHPVYFFVTKHRPELAKQLERGLKIALQDGSFKKLFLDSFGKIIQQGELDKRHLIILKNPVVPARTQPFDTSWWLPQKFQSQLRNSP
ncbi:hypothetical protein [Kiloniella sp.]|uniref:hypothetical protein n=1 Tax=Kiloniella sp. TaxID=1938587 RepID=UPI003B01389F